MGILCIILPGHGENVRNCNDANLSRLCVFSHVRIVSSLSTRLSPGCFVF